MTIRLLPILFSAALLVAAGCDDHPQPPPPAATQSADNASHSTDPDASSPRPTTQQLSEGTWQRIPLQAVPFTAEVPQGWAIKSLGKGDIILLQGPGSINDVQMQLATRPGATDDQIQLLLSSAKREMNAHPEVVRKVDLRTHENMKIFERSNLLRADPGSGGSDLMGWTIDLFVPRDKDFRCYELNFVGLTAAEFQGDEPILRRVIDSLKLERSPDSAR